MKLNAKARDAVETLLNIYSALSQAEARVGKTGQDFGITVSTLKDDSDFLSVGIAPQVAKEAIRQERASVKSRLAKYGIAVD